MKRFLQLVILVVLFIAGAVVFHGCGDTAATDSSSTPSSSAYGPNP